jgi:alpha-D-xyloside xylohydrolase
VDYPEDQTCWEVEDQFMFGSDLLVAPILYEGQRRRRLYLPQGAWTEAWEGKEYDGGQWIEVDAPIERIPVFWRGGSESFFLFSSG